MAVQQSHYHSIHGVTERSSGHGDQRGNEGLVVPSLSPANHRLWSPVKLTPLTAPDCFTASFSRIYFGDGYSLRLSFSFFSFHCTMVSKGFSRDSKETSDRSFLFFSSTCYLLFHFTAKQVGKDREIRLSLYLL